jgi:hypothetical protein
MIMQGIETRTRLQLEGLPTPVVTRVVRRSDQGATLHQPLPFLQLQGAVVDENGRRGRIEWVDVALDGDVPALVLEVSYQPRIPDPRMLPTPTAPSTRGAPSRRDATVPFELPNARALSQPPIPIGEPTTGAPGMARPREGGPWATLLSWLRRLVPWSVRTATPRALAAPGSQR